MHSKTFAKYLNSYDVSTTSSERVQKPNTSIQATSPGSPKELLPKQKKLRATIVFPECSPSIARV